MKTVTILIRPPPAKHNNPQGSVATVAGPCAATPGPAWTESVTLKMLEAVAALEPSHTKRSDEQIHLQQFSTPLPLAYAALQAATIRPSDVVLEPSAAPASWR